VGATTLPNMARGEVGGSFASRGRLRSRLRLILPCLAVGLTACSATSATSVTHATRSTPRSTVTRTSVGQPCETTYPGSACISKEPPPNTFATPVALGTPVHITWEGDEAFSATVTVSRVLMNVAPASLLGYHSSSEGFQQWASSQRWVGIDLTITNMSESDTFGPTGQEGTLAPAYAINGQSLLSQEPSEPEYFDAVILGTIGVAGCPLPGIDELAQGATTSGCIALPNQSAGQVTTVGVGITVNAYQYVGQYAQWRA
jgi:hypothetical protein